MCVCVCVCVCVCFGFENINIEIFRIESVDYIKELSAIYIHNSCGVVEYTEALHQDSPNIEAQLSQPYKTQDLLPQCIIAQRTTLCAAQTTSMHPSL